MAENEVKRTQFKGDITIPANGVLYWHLYVENSAKDL